PPTRSRRRRRLQTARGSSRLAGLLWSAASIAPLDGFWIVFLSCSRRQCARQKKRAKTSKAAMLAALQSSPVHCRRVPFDTCSPVCYHHPTNCPGGPRASGSSGPPPQNSRAAPMTVPLRVFISSTSKDLLHFRAAVVEVVGKQEW